MENIPKDLSQEFKISYLTNGLEVGPWSLYSDHENLFFSAGKPVQRRRE